MAENDTGTVVWLTGLSAAGKTTIAVRLAQILRARGVAIVHLDGDGLREVMGGDLGYDHAARLDNAYRLARLCRLLSRQGVHVICSTMSLFPEIWAWNREHLPRYIEVYLRVSSETIARRDPAGLYSRARAGEERNVVGIDLPFHEPPAPELVIDNDADGEPGIGAALRAILERLPFSEAR